MVNFQQLMKVVQHKSSSTVIKLDDTLNADSLANLKSEPSVEDVSTPLQKQKSL